MTARTRAYRRRPRRSPLCIDRSPTVVRPRPAAAEDRAELLSVRALPAARPGCMVIEVVGEVDSYTAPLLEVCLSTQAGRPDVRRIEVDLRRVTSLGSAGVAALARAHRLCRSNRARLVIRTGGHNRSRTPGVQAVF
jgi:anti-sigma B factor antagonist